ncbi:TetR/AcrR family transcriptional regulator C-terminal domain-containing protein [Rothia halotolerans]|uniref:TetR/AcrR family transcriptional regulator C-terminal domain-containing protein n=1 Tax=Rothia halotolerans TaxID=405770 RepID=UPI00101D49B3|nr:TetR/AcrR family transcriptional regulator C-terminal domain-containing protein [Rothia halotolerans]
MDSETTKRKGHRTSARGLDRDQVIDAALQMIDAEGPHLLTMRGLGKELGVEAMSLYRYVTGREELLEAVVVRLLEGLMDQLDGSITGSWQGYLQNLAHSVRDLALAHPRAFPLIATRHPAAPWLRPPLRSLEVVENFLTTLGDFGFTDAQKVGAYRSFTSFLLGHLLLDAAARGGGTGPVEDPLDEGDAQIPHGDGNTDLSRESEVYRLRDALSEDHGEEEFESSLETLLDRIELELSQ